MIFFYFGLSISILTGIFSVFKYSTILMKQQMDSSLVKNDYIGSSSQQVDRIFMRLLQDSDSSWGQAPGSCVNLNFKFVESGQSEFYRDKYMIGKDTPSKHKDLLNSCVLTNGLHRVILAPSKMEPYKFMLYSCNTKHEEFCSFEFN